LRLLSNVFIGKAKLGCAREMIQLFSFDRDAIFFVEGVYSGIQAEPI
jgi:hypothetical protein